MIAWKSKLYNITMVLFEAGLLNTGLSLVYQSKDFFFFSSSINDSPNFVSNFCIDISSDFRLDILLILAFVSYPSLKYLLLVWLPLQILRSIPSCLPCCPWTLVHFVFGTRNLSNPPVGVHRPSSFMNFILRRWWYNTMGSVTAVVLRWEESLFLWLLLYPTFGGEKFQKSP